MFMQFIPLFGRALTYRNFADIGGIPFPLFNEDDSIILMRSGVSFSRGEAVLVPIPCIRYTRCSKSSILASGWLGNLRPPGQAPYHYRGKRSSHVFRDSLKQSDTTGNLQIDSNALRGGVQ